MNLSEITETFVQGRRDALENRWGARNERMNDYEKLYLLDMWGSQAEPDERRISLPIAWTRVEAFRPLFITRQPVISVPLSDIQAVEQERADKVEKYLYGVWYEANVMRALDLGEWAACCLGEGVLRCVFNDEVADGDLPLLVTAIDPRNVYATPGTKPGRDREIVHYLKRPRREVESEWGQELREGGRPTDVEELERWLDTDVDYIDYWREDLAEVEEEPREAVEEELGPLAKAMDWARKQFEDVFGTVTAAPEPETRTVKRWQVVNCVLADEEFVKKPVVMPGYNRVPFIRYAGISTLLDGENGSLSVLFPITAGVHKPGTEGVAAAMSELATLKQRIIELYAAGAFVTDDQSLASVDTKPGALNRISRDAKLNWITPPGPHPSIDQQIAMLDQQLEDATVSRAMMGGTGGDLSGLAISAMNNPVLMRIASRQMTRERAYQDLNELILSLTEQYAPPEGWNVSGPDRMDMDMEVQLRPDEIAGYYRNRVELTASLPKDEAGEIMVLSSLVDKRQLSRETFLDQLQRIKRFSVQSPTDEMKRIMRDAMLFEGPTAEVLARLILTEYDAELADMLQQQLQQQQAQPGPEPAPGPQPGGQGPMGGIPTSVVPPGAVPPMMGPEGMMAMEGNPPPQAGGPPAPPGPGPRMR